MRTTRGILILVAIGLTPLAPADRAAGQDIHVWAFATLNGEERFPSGQQPYIRRGRGSTVRIVKHLIDLVPFNQVSVRGGGATISNLTRGQQSGTGYIQMTMHVPSTTAVGTIVTLSVGLTDRFTFRVVRNAIVTSITPNPAPSTIQAGTPWTATVQGSDIGSPVIDMNRVQCHNVNYGARTNNSVAITLTRAATCATSGFALVLLPIANETPSAYRTSAGDVVQLGFSYAPPPPSGVTCVSRPDIGSVIVTFPTPNQSIVFGSGTATPANVTIRWQSNTTPGNVPAPLNEFVVTRRVTNNFGIPLNVPTTVTGTSVTFAFAIPGTHTISIRAKNCGDPSPTTTFTFSTRYQ